MDEIEEYVRPKKAGSIRKILVENFMCHSSLTIELGDRVNFITGQNGSGKSAILTALCVAFGIKARGTQRANSIKDFIKNGCRYALVVVELNNVGEDAFKHSLFGDTIFVERRINENSSTFAVKDSQGRKVGVKKEDVLEVVEHFNIDVENPCVIMTQDKSREFLHGGSDKDKYKFFFKATLLQLFNESISNWGETIDTTVCFFTGSKANLLPQKTELRQIEEQLKTLEHVEMLRKDIEKLEKIYACSLVKQAEKALQVAEAELLVFKKRMPICQKKIDDAQLKVDQKKQAHVEKSALITRMMQRSEELKQSQHVLKMALDEAMREKVQADEDTKRVRRILQETKDRLCKFELDISEMRQRMLQDTQAELDEKLKEIQALECGRRIAEEEFQRLQNEESLLNSEVELLFQQKAVIFKEVEDLRAQLRDLKTYVQNLEAQQTNKVTAFGGDGVLRLLQAIEENCDRFTKPPLGPIGAHVGLVDGSWSLAVEVAVGRMFNNFIVTNQRDTLLLRNLGNRAGCRNLGIITASFDRPLIKPTPDDLPDRSLLTVLGCLHSQNATVMNVLIDQGGADQKVLVQDYSTGKNIAFNGGSRNVKEVITIDGVRMYTRNGAEITLPKDRRTRDGRLGVRVDEKIRHAQMQESELNTYIQESESRKRKLDHDSRRSREKIETVKRRREEGERALRRQEFKLRDLKDAVSNENEMNKECNTLELQEEIDRTRTEMVSKEDKLMKSELKFKAVMSKWANAKSQLEQLCESARVDHESLQVAEQELLTLGQELHEAHESVAQFQKIMEKKVIEEIAKHEEKAENMRQNLEVVIGQASQICPEKEREQFGEDTRSSEQLSHQIIRQQELVKKQENENGSLEQVIKKANKIRKKIQAKERWHTNFQEKLDVLQDRYANRKRVYGRTCAHMRRDLTWGFNSHLGRKGFSGHVNVDFGEKTLTMSVQMPQDGSNTSVRDTRALSGGERSFSTLAFALAVHNMTEAPFRAMDEFDVFMDAVSRKISLDTAVEFALREGSQWIFITPHDISMVKGNPMVKKQQMPAPRP